MRRRNSIDSLQDAVNDIEYEINQFNDLLRDKDDEIVGLQKEIANLNDIIDEYQEEIAALKAQMHDNEHDNQHLTHF